MGKSRKKNPIVGVSTASSDKQFKQAEHGRERAAVRIALARGDDTPSPRAFGDPWHGDKDGKLYMPGSDLAYRK